MFFVDPFEISSGFVHLELVLIVLMDTRFRFFEKKLSFEKMGLLIDL